jgi:tetratricopeptide (TPR) repeat protein
MGLSLEKIGSILRDKRQQLGKRIEDMVDENISRSTISNAERGLPNVTEPMYIYYAQKLELGSSLFGIVDEKERLELEADEELKEIENVISVDPDDSLEKLTQIKETYQITKRDNLYPFFAYLLGRCAYEQKKWKKTKAYLQEAISLFEQKQELAQKTNLKAACYNELSRVAFFENQLEDALQYNVEGFESFYPDGERPRYQFHFLLNKSIYLRRLKQPEKALEAVEALNAAIEHVPNVKTLLSTVHLYAIIDMYNMYAVILADLQLYEKALDYANQGLEIAQNNRSSDHILTLRTTLGTIYFKLGNFPKAEKCFFMALNLKKGADKEYLLISVYIKLSQLLRKKGKFQQAEKLLREAISISERDNEKIHLIESLVNLGDCSVQQKKFNQAIPTYQKVEQLLNTSKNKEMKCEIAVNLGYCYQQLGNQKLFEEYRNNVFLLNSEMKWGDYHD